MKNLIIVISTGTVPDAGKIELIAISPANSITEIFFMAEINETITVCLN